MGNRVGGMGNRVADLHSLTKFQEILRIDCLKTFLPFEEYFLLSLFPCSLPWLSRKRNGSRTAYAYLYASSTWISWYEYDKALEFENSRCQSYNAKVKRLSIGLGTDGSRRQTFGACCHAGHALCSSCKARVLNNKCPNCRQQLSNIRCLALEKMAKSGTPRHFLLRNFRERKVGVRFQG
ncbi:E3 ubiquitin-protein ligase SINAT3 [Vitis vinifera]|uniref:E3 ubiquitin-protein ligase SINAT3 n=1 Tax=Vitis vinifera TaxID=29760 RepID=A0A438IF63_VITVI|nr:E3 ubiquitin-protein ligase SINAT3 [Vitis vinifera]